MLTRRSFLLGSCAGVLVLERGCGGSSSPVTQAISVATPTPTPTPSPTPTPTSTSSAAPAGIVVQAGDSIGVGYAAGDYAAIDHLGFGAGVVVHNVSVSGRTMQTGYQQRAELLAFYDAAQPCVLLIQQGTNDLFSYGTTADDLYGAVATPFVRAARTAGFYVVLGTLLPRNDASWTAASEAQRLRYNASVRANAAGADAINDLAADPVIGDASGVPALYYADGLHPTVAGQQRIAVVDATTLAPLLTLAPRGTG